uniref:Retinoic acid receptor responder protein 3-like n=1 Tax=Saccoglossus kowalevskii TaxID=10224 RepID=A0ABM0MPX4_SACKO|nr:PREDICTED: retinoic acid receptor responder protein 3-like [Saccoglossus kowalevskii]
MAAGAFNNNLNDVDIYDYKVGDMLAFRHIVYDHFAVYIGNGNVIHLTGESEVVGISGKAQYVFSVSGKQYNKAVVKCDRLEDVDGKARIKNKDAKNKPPLPPRQILARATEKLGPIEYNVEDLLIGIGIGALGIIAVGVVAGVILNMNDDDGDDEEEKRRRRRRRRRIKQNYE